MVTLGLMGTIAIISMPIVLFVPFQKFQHKYLHDKCAWPLYAMFSSLKVSYDEGYERERVSVYLQNHVSMLDANISIGSIPVPLCGLENAAHLKIPGYGWLLRISNAIPVRKGSRRFSAIVEAFRERASRGISVLAFPEGHRTLDGKVRPFKSGVFRAARDAGLPIVPIASRGAYRLMPKGTPVIRPAKIEVYVAPQIDTEGLSDAELPLLIERVHTIIEAWVERGEKLGHLAHEPFVARESATGS